MIQRSRLEILVGFFVILALVILTFMVFLVSGVYFLKQGYKVDAIFNFVGNLEKGAVVRFSGIPVGNVMEIGLTEVENKERPVVRVRLFLSKGIELRENDRVRIEGIYGLSNPHLAIKPYPDKSGRILHDGDILTGVDPIPMDDLVARGESIARELQKTVESMNSVINDKKMIEDARGILVNMNALTFRMNEILKNQEGDFAETMRDLSQGMDHLNNITQKLDKGEGTAGKLLSDEGLYLELQDFVRDLKAHPWKLLRKGKEETPQPVMVQTSSGQPQAVQPEKKKRILGIF